MPKASVFISHSSNDKVFATSVAAELRETNFTPWIDKERIYVGADILEELGKGLTAMDLFVLIVSREAVELGVGDKGNWVRSISRNYGKESAYSSLHHR